MKDNANYYYEVMPFRLKNIRATNQPLIGKVFKGMLRQSFEVYIDDIMVKSDLFDQHTKDLRVVFNALQRTDMQLNLEKCVFGWNGETHHAFNCPISIRPEVGRVDPIMVH